MKTCTSCGETFDPTPTRGRPYVRCQACRDDARYGYKHRQLRQQWKPKVEAGLVDCWRCKELIPPDAEWDLGHDDLDRARYRGPEHTYCNRTTSTRRLPNQPSPILRRGQPHPRGERQCEICGTRYRPTYHAQRTCGRGCGAVLQLQNRPAHRGKRTTWAPDTPLLICPVCLTLCVPRNSRSRTCGGGCTIEANMRNIRSKYRERLGIPDDWSVPVKRHNRVA